MKRNYVKLFFVLLIVQIGIPEFSAQSNSKLSVSIENEKTNDWYQFRGPNRNGKMTTKQKQNLHTISDHNIGWRKEIGYGYSGLITNGDKLYSMWDQGDSQFVFCLNAESGDEIWKFRIDQNYESSWGDGPLSTPIIVEDIIYAISTTGKLFALNADNGKEIWKKDLAEDFGLQLPLFGYAPSPIIIENKIFIQTGGKEETAFFALDKDSGDILWSNHKDDPAYASPISFSIDELLQVVFMSRKGLYSFNTDSGELLWEYEWEAMCPSAGPMNSISPFSVEGNRIFVSGGAGSVTGAGFIEITKSGGNYQLHEFWYNQEMNNVINPSVFIDGYIYGFHDRKLRCINAENGEFVWENKGFGDGSLIALDNYLLILGERGKFTIAEANHTKYTEVYSAQILKGRCWTPPSIFNNNIILRNQKELLSIELIEK